MTSTGETTTIQQALEAFANASKKAGVITDAEIAALGNPQKALQELLRGYSSVHVTIVGLARRADLNGKAGDIFGLQDPSTGRWPVRVGNESVLVKAVNLRPQEIFNFGSLDLALGTDAAGIVQDMLECTRCHGPTNDDSLCMVPHPRQYRIFGGSEFSQGVGRSTYTCGVCQQMYVEVVRNGGDPVIEGPKFCFKGLHSHQPLCHLDKREATLNTVVLIENPNLQQQINNLDASTEILSITAGNSGYNEQAQYEFAVHLPNLRELVIEDVNMILLQLTDNLTPNLEKLSFQNIPQECDICLLLPKLKEFESSFFRGDGEQIQNMIDNAPLLESFTTYKLWSNDELRFTASPELRTISIHRSDSLMSLQFWAPKLTTLNLQACYSLDSINLVPLNPPGFVPPRRPPALEVNIMNANISPRAMRTLESIPNVTIVGDDEDQGWW